MKLPRLCTPLFPTCYVQRMLQRILLSLIAYNEQGIDMVCGETSLVILLQLTADFLPRREKNKQWLHDFFPPPGCMRTSKQVCCPAPDRIGAVIACYSCQSPAGVIQEHYGDTSFICIIIINVWLSWTPASFFLRGRDCRGPHHKPIVLKRLMKRETVPLLQLQDQLGNEKWIWKLAAEFCEDTLVKEVKCRLSRDKINLTMAIPLDELGKNEMSFSALNRWRDSLALLVQQVEQRCGLLADQVNAACVVDVVDVVPADALCPVLLLHRQKKKKKWQSVLHHAQNHITNVF